LAIACSLN